MNLITYIQNQAQLDLAIQSQKLEIILESKELSRFGKLSVKDLNELSKNAKDAHLKVCLEWDVLMTENEFAAKTDVLNQIDFNYIDAIRVQDAGAMNYALDHLDCKIQLILEGGNHNLRSVQTWIDYIGERIDRVVLSIELDKKTLKEYCQQLTCPVEFMGLGRILLFYTPRNLLSALLPQDDEKRIKAMTSEEFLEATGESEESPHKGFPLIENMHGTFMFHIKRLFLLENLEDLTETGLKFLRVDFRFDDTFRLKEIENLLLDKVKAKEFKDSYGFDVIKGYFNINKTDVLFKKLKNFRIQRKDDSYIGEVIETAKSEYMAILVKKNTIKMNDELKFITPEGKELTCKVHFLKDSNNQDIDSASKDKLCLINYFSGVWPKSQVYLQ